MPFLLPTINYSHLSILLDVPSSGYKALKWKKYQKTSHLVMPGRAVSISPILHPDSVIIHSSSVLLLFRWTLRRMEGDFSSIGLC